MEYFRSGWAFLIPYLAAYLLYAWLKWPVNVAGAGGTEPGARSWVPCLLHVYWVLHAIHLLLGTIAFRAWWKVAALKLQLSTSTGAPGARPPSPTHLPLETVYRLLPWILLGLILWIPGAYLEWPSDPWEHLRRIHEWQELDAVTAHSTWRRSGSFLFYSLIGRTSELNWLNLCYTGTCLLLCWQYYRLARVIGLGNVASTIFVLLQALLLGNNIFSFYRYYGLSTSIIAQLGAIALIRRTLESLQRGTAQQKARGDWLIESGKDLGDIEAVCNDSGWPHRQSPPFIGFFWQAIAVLSLLALTAFNHIQAIGIVGLGITSVIVWRLIEWKRSMIGWITCLALVLNLSAIIWFPKDPVLEEYYQPHGWLNAWLGFNIYSPGSPACERAMEIFGFAGLLNMAAGIFLISRNHVSAYLTIVPVVSLSLPFISIPLASALASHYSNHDGIVTFHRLLLSIPCGLALTCLASDLWNRRFNGKAPSLFNDQTRAWFAFAVLVLVLAGFIVAPAERMIFNRLWNILGVVPSDLQMRSIMADYTKLPALERRNVSRLLTTPGIGFVLRSAGIQNVFYQENRTFYSAPPTLPSARAVLLEHFVQVGPSDKISGLLWAPSSTALFTPFSTNAVLSSHWQIQEVALNLVGTHEAYMKARSAGWKRLHCIQPAYLLNIEPLHPDPQTNVGAH